MRLWTKSLVWIVAMASIVSGIALLSRIPSTAPAEAPVDAVYKVTHIAPRQGVAPVTVYSDTLDATASTGGWVVKDKADGLYKIFQGGALRITILKPEGTPVAAWKNE